MKAYLGFLTQHYQAVLFGWLLTFFSSMGQTFFISLFVPGLLLTFSLSNAAFGAYYAIATVVASLFLLRFGHVIDTRPIRPFTYKTVILLAISCFILGMAIHPAMVFVALIGLRLAGQGLMGHISQSVMSRHFEADRGKALSLTSLGYSIGEIIFPFSLAILLILTDWRIALYVSAGILVFALLPALKFMKLETYDVKETSGSKGPDWKFFLEMIKEKPFWHIALPSFLVPCIITGLFFYQYVLAELRGWPLEWYALCFMGYAAMRLVFSLYGGILNDRFSARTLFPYILIPLIAGLFSLAWIPGKYAALSFLLLTGITVGMIGVVKAAIIAEVYGIRKIGQVKSLFTVGMVVFSAVGPIAIGFMLDFGITFSQIAWGSGLLLFLVMLHTFATSSFSREPSSRSEAADFATEMEESPSA